VRAQAHRPAKPKKPPGLSPYLHGTAFVLILQEFFSLLVA
jgi:hypothetical protein